MSGCVFGAAVFVSTSSNNVLPPTWSFRFERSSNPENQYKAPIPKAARSCQRFSSQLVGLKLNEQHRPRAMVPLISTLFGAYN